MTVGPVIPVIGLLRMLSLVWKDWDLSKLTIINKSGYADFDASAFFQILLDFSRGAGILE